MVAIFINKLAYSDDVSDESMTFSQVLAFRSWVAEYIQSAQANNNAMNFSTLLFSSI